MLDYRDISVMESVPLMWGPVAASPVGIEPMTILERGGALIKGSLGGETSVLRTFRMSGKELVKERVSEGKS